MPPTAPCPLSSTHHVGVAVRSLDEHIALYRDLFGLAPGLVLEAPAYGVRGVFISTGNTNIELVEPTSPDSPIARFLEARGEGLHHVCFEVDDIKGKLAALKEQGVRLVDQAPRPGLAGGVVAFLHRSAGRGVLIELAEHPHD